MLGHWRLLVSILLFAFCLVNTHMCSKRDIKMVGWVHGAGEGSPRNCRWGCDVPFF